MSSPSSNHQDARKTGEDEKDTSSMTWEEILDQLNPSTPSGSPAIPQRQGASQAQGYELLYQHWHCVYVNPYCRPVKTPTPKKGGLQASHWAPKSTPAGPREGQVSSIICFQLLR